jgi:cyclic-di-GMP-binding biofilm dispersal mediator protein
MNLLIIGGASGLGRALVDLALSAGHQVSVLDHDTAGLAALPSTVPTAICDIADSGSVDDALAAVSHRSPFDLVAITAGVSAVGRFEEIDPAAMDRVTRINLTGTMMMTHALIARGCVARGGRLVLTSSLSYFVSYPGASAYAATKDGVVVFGKSIRRELQRVHGVTVQIVAPGPMDTPHAARYAPPGSRADRRAKPRAIAAQILRRRRGGLFVPDLASRGAAIAGSLLPQVVGRLMRKIIYRKLP